MKSVVPPTPKYVSTLRKVHKNKDIMITKIFTVAYLQYQANKQSQFLVIEVKDHTDSF